MMNEFSRDLIPAYSMSSIHRYIDEHQRVGGFLTAVLSNDLAGSIRRADPDNLGALLSILGYLHYDAPAQCWGSPEKVRRWLEIVPIDEELEARIDGDVDVACEMCSVCEDRALGGNGHTDGNNGGEAPQ